MGACGVYNRQLNMQTDDGAQTYSGRSEIDGIGHSLRQTAIHLEFWPSLRPAKVTQSQSQKRV